jgi:glycosyltransferase involved in cell wall biosynthesis
MPRFSLIVATFGRSGELPVLLDSLAKQEMRDFELIVVDQNSDDRVSACLNEWVARPQDCFGHPTFDLQVKHLHCPPGASRARNLGLLHSTGEILAFPDDDCWYYPDTLLRVDQWLRTHEDYGILSLACKDEEGRTSGNPWIQTESDLNWMNIFYASATYSYFVRRPIKSVPLLFDETLGPGAPTRFGSGEDIDFLLTLINHGIRGRFYSLLHIGHPLKRYINVQRSRSYGGGCGRVLAKHSLPVLGLALVGTDLLRAMLLFVRGDRNKASQRWAHGMGVVSAYFSKA